MNLNPEQKEELRHAVLAAAAVRAPAALTVPQLTRAVKREVPFLCDATDVVAAAEILKDLNLLEASTDDLGSTTYWRATAAGILYVERT